MARGVYRLKYVWQSHANELIPFFKENKIYDSKTLFRMYTDVYGTKFFQDSRQFASLLKIMVEKNMIERKKHPTNKQKRMWGLKWE